MVGKEDKKTLNILYMLSNAKLTANAVIPNAAMMPILESDVSRMGILNAPLHPPSL